MAMPSADRIANERIPTVPASKRMPEPPPTIKPLPPAIVEALKADRPTPPKAASPPRTSAPISPPPVNLGGQLAATSGSETAKVAPIPSSSSTWSFQPEPPPAASSTTRRFDGGNVVITTTIDGDRNTSVATIRNGDGTTTKSWIERQSIEGNLENVVPPELTSMLEDQVIEDGEAARGPVEMVHRKIQDIDRSGVPVTRTDTTSYTQHISTTFSKPGDPASSIRMPDPDDPAAGVLPTELDLQANDFGSLDSQRSGQTITLTTGSVLSSQGQMQAVQSRSNELRLVGTSAHGGGPAEYSQSTHLSILDGQVVSDSRILEAKNLFVPADIDELDEFASLKLHDDFRQRVTTGETFDYRRIVDSSHKARVTREFGDYASPQQNGQSVTVVDAMNGQPTSLTYNKVSEGGSRAQSQTVFEGTQLSTVSDFRVFPNGDREGSIVTRDGQQTLSSSQESSRLVSVAETTAQELGVDPVWWELFVNQHPEATVRVESSSSENVAAQEKSNRLSVTVPGGDFLRSSSLETDQGTASASFMNLAGTARPERVRLEQDGELQNFSVDREGNVRLNGVIQTVSEVAGTAEQVTSLSRVLSDSKLGGVFGAINLSEAAAALANGEITLETASELASSSSDLLSLAGRQLAGRLLGGAGAGLNAVEGVNDLVNGRFAQGADNLIQAAGMSLVLAGFPGAGWTVLAGLTAFQLVKNLAPDESDFATAPLVI